MSRICEHEFEAKDRQDPRYSLVEFDLAARTGLTIRKNHEDGYYEIVLIKQPREVKYRNVSLEKVVQMANFLEDSNDIQIGCGLLCPNKMR